MSDRSSAFVNAIQHCFPNSTLIQCYSHIVRKFIVNGNRDGNGAYYKYAEGCGIDWFKNVVLLDIKLLHRCCTKEQFMKYWSLTREEWLIKGQRKLASTFAKSYIESVEYSGWFFCISGLTAAVPDNNPVELHNKHMKGTSDMNGMILIHRNMLQVLNDEFPKLVYLMSERNLNGPRLEWPIIDQKKAFNNMEFMAFQDVFEFEVDALRYKDGWLVNSTKFLAEPITADDVQRMEDAKQGIFELCWEERTVLVERTERFHYVTKVDNIYCCTCRDFYYSRWCFQSAMLQHRHFLENKGESLQSRRSITGKAARKMTDRRDIQAAQKKKRTKAFLSDRTL